MRRILWILALAILMIAVAIATAWAGLALWYRLPGPELARALGGGLFVLLGLAAIIALFGRSRFRCSVDRRFALSWND